MQNSTWDRAGEWAGRAVVASARVVQLAVWAAAGVLALLGRGCSSLVRGTERVLRVLK